MYRTGMWFAAFAFAAEAIVSYIVGSYGVAAIAFSVAAVLFYNAD